MTPTANRSSPRQTQDFACSEGLWWCKYYIKSLTSALRTQRWLRVEAGNPYLTQLSEYVVSTKVLRLVGNCNPSCR